MKFEGEIVTGLNNALIGARLPMCRNFEEAEEKVFGDNEAFRRAVQIGERLCKADTVMGFGQPNSKFLRMIHVQVAVTAPLYWWNEYDTYKIGTTANSTSKMHKIHFYAITKDCFEHGEEIFPETIEKLEALRQEYNRTKNKEVWKKLIINLPESWLYTRMLDLDYQTLRNIYYWRSNHKLTEWHDFCEFITTLPYAKEFLISEGE